MRYSTLFLVSGAITTTFVSTKLNKNPLRSFKKVNNKTNKSDIESVKELRLG